MSTSDEKSAQSHKTHKPFRLRPRRQRGALALRGATRLVAANKSATHVALDWTAAPLAHTNHTLNTVHMTAALATARPRAHGRTARKQLTADGTSSGNVPRYGENNVDIIRPPAQIADGLLINFGEYDRKFNPYKLYNSMSSSLSDARKT
ncbi:unnamed protein product, partial [Iphiclides podalirius]